MTIYVDDLVEWPNGKGEWCHMATDDEDLAKLHELAYKIDLKRSWFQDKPGFPHYDLRPKKRERAVKLGAVAVSPEELVRLCKRV